jgi:hypothetical protein
MSKLKSEMNLQAAAKPQAAGNVACRYCQPIVAGHIAPSATLAV